MRRRIVLALVISILSLGLIFFAFLHWVCLRPECCRYHDWESFVASAQALQAGLNPYAVTTDRANLNPPALLPLFELQLDLHVSLFQWYLLSLALYGTIVLVLYRHYHAPPLRVLWSLAILGLWLNLYEGQVYILLLALVAGAWLSLESGHDRAAGVFIGIAVACKPNLAVWLALLFVARYWTIALSACLSFAVANLLAVVRYGPGIYPQWIAVTRATAQINPSGNASLFNLAHQLGVDALGLPLAVLLLAFLAAWSWRSRPDRLALSGAALIGSVLASPVTWSCTLLILLPVYFSKRVWDWRFTLSAVLLAVPTYVISSRLDWLVYLSAVALLWSIPMPLPVTSICHTLVPARHPAVEAQHKPL